MERLDQELERQASENLMLADRVKQMQQRLQVHRMQLLLAVSPLDEN